MRGGALLWLKHRQSLPDAARERLRSILELAVEGSLRHKVPASYSNIALMNACNLSLLGEALDKPRAAEAGYARLRAVLDYTAACGVHEFVSPTYTGVDLDGLAVLEAYTGNATARAQARALLELFWTDIALNWFPPAQRLAGANSRTYDFLFGRGYLDVELNLNGWYDKPVGREMDAIYGAQARWHPAQKLRDLSARSPRLVRQAWGPEPWQSRTHYLLADITLSSSASSYGGWMDMPLTVDFAGSALSPRCYFVADGRNDPYGKNRIPAGAHQKALHLNPFWMAAQEHEDALCLVVYRPKDIPTNATVLGSNFVLPLDADDFRVGDRAVSLKREIRIPVDPGEVVSVRKGAGIVGIRVLWSRSCAGGNAATFLVNDGNPYGVARLLVEHAAPGTVPANCTNSPGAVLWLRTGTGITNELARQDFVARFQKAGEDVAGSPEALRAHASGLRGKLELEASAPWSQPGNLQPAPSRAVLEYDRRDMGRDILAPVLNSGAGKPSDPDR
jgi:hypothetical protein